MIPIRQPSTDSNRACQAGADRSSGTFHRLPMLLGPPVSGEVPQPVLMLGDRVHFRRSAIGQWLRDHETLKFPLGNCRLLSGGSKPPSFICTVYLPVSPPVTQPTERLPAIVNHPVRGQMLQSPLRCGSMVDLPEPELTSTTTANFSRPTSQSHLG